MYLFQRIHKIWKYCISNIYIPLCIYFNKDVFSKGGEVFRFTFHYVSISTDSFGHWEMDCVVFTFHYVSISTASIKNEGGAADKFTFHYVSISTYCPCKRRTPILIYIPLCIYFNWRSLGGSSRYIVIYIPLCIYFNKSQKRAWELATSFTFHYVSISTKQIWNILIFFINLHSTMYLFQHCNLPT